MWERTMYYALESRQGNTSKLIGWANVQAKRVLNILSWILAAVGWSIPLLIIFKPDWFSGIIVWLMYQL